MAELIWAGKQSTSSPPPIYSFHTCEVYNAEETRLPNEYWHNRLILGDKHDVLPALLPEFVGRINLIYIDPPFMTGRHFASYSDTWSNNLDTYLQWLCETLVLL